MGGLDKVDSGSIIVNDVNIKDYSSYKMDEYKNTNIGFIFQNYNLIDHLTIFENIILPTKIERINQKEIKEKAYNLLEKLNLEKEASKYPKEVSGGQLQRAAIARALITDAKIRLPFTKNSHPCLLHTARDCEIAVPTSLKQNIKARILI